MIAQEYKKMLGAKSVIREMFTYGTERAKEIGKENVWKNVSVCHIKKNIFSCAPVLQQLWHMHSVQ